MDCQFKEIRIRNGPKTVQDGKIIRNFIKNQTKIVPKPTKDETWRPKWAKMRRKSTKHNAQTRPRRGQDAKVGPSWLRVAKRPKKEQKRNAN